MYLCIIILLLFRVSCLIAKTICVCRVAREDLHINDSFLSRSQGRSLGGGCLSRRGLRKRWASKPPRPQGLRHILAACAHPCGLGASFSSSHGMIRFEKHVCYPFLQTYVQTVTVNCQDVNVNLNVYLFKSRSCTLIS